MPTEKYPVRIDMAIEISGEETAPDGTCYFNVAMRPDPKKYDVVTRAGERGFLSKSEGTFIPMSTFEKMAEQMAGLPIYHTPPREDDICSYMVNVREELLSHWDDKYLVETTIEPSQLYLKQHEGELLDFHVLYIDLVGSTKLSTTLKPDDLERYVKIYCREMAKIIDNYRGYILKYVGDCVVGYFPGFSVSMADNVVWTAIVMRSLIEDVLNPIYSSKGYPPISYRIGLDFGEAKVVQMGAEGINSSNDLLGYTLNLAAKIQSTAKPNEIILGESVYLNAHISLQELCEVITPPSNWEYPGIGGEGKYKIYRLKGKWHSKCILESAP